MRDQSTLSYIVEKYMQKHNLNFRQLEDRVGVSFSYLAKIARGEVSAPTRDILIQLAIGMEESPYRLLVAAGHVVNLDRDIVIKNIHLSDRQLRDLLNKYRICALPNLKRVINKSGRIDSLARQLKWDNQKLHNVASGHEAVSLEDATSLCIFLSSRFTELFKVIKVTYDVKFIGAKDDGEVAYQIRNYIDNEMGKHILDHPNLQEEATKEPTKYTLEMVKEHKVEYEVLDDNLTLDELVYLKECLDMYRRLKLRSEK